MSLGISKHKEEERKELRNKVEEFLKKGGEIKQYPPEQRTQKEFGVKSNKVYED